MTIEALGQKVKAKYPQYASMDDAEVGRRVAEKYPEYAAQVEQPAPAQQAPDAFQKAAGLTDTFFGSGKIGEAIGTAKVRQDVLSGRIGGGVEAEYDKITPEIAARMQAKGIPTTLEGKRQQVAQGITGPTKGQLAGSALQSAALFTPIGKVAGTLGKIGAGAATGAVFDVATNLQEGKTGMAALTPGVGTALGAAIPGAGKALGALSRTASGQAPRIINSLIKPLQKDFSYGKDPGRAVAGIVANDFDELITKISENRQATGRAIGELGRKIGTKPVVDVEDALDYLDDAMRTAASQNNATLLSRLQGVKKAINTNLEHAVDEAGNIGIKEVGARKLNGLTFSESRDILRQIGDITQFTGNPSDDKIVNSALKQVYGRVKERSLQAADSINPQLGKEFRTLTERYADLSSAEIAAKYRDKILERSSLIGFSPQVAGVATALLTFATTGQVDDAIIAGIGGAVLDKLAASPAFKTRLAALLSGKSTQQLTQIYQRVPALKQLFPPGSAMSPGDYLLETDTGKKVSASVGNSLKNPSMGLSVQRVGAGEVSQALIKRHPHIHPHDLNVMVKLIDNVDTRHTARDAQNLAAHWGIATDKGPGHIVNEFRKILDGTKKVKGTIEQGRDDIGRYAPNK